MSIEDLVQNDGVVTMEQMRTFLNEKLHEELAEIKIQMNKIQFLIVEHLVKPPGV